MIKIGCHIYRDMTVSDIRITLEDGKRLVMAAREAVTRFLKEGSVEKDTNLESRFSAKSGVFVTLNDSSGLRGCIGYPFPDRNLSFALTDAAVSAATRDPRFTPLNLEELNHITFEITILTPPERIQANSPDEYIAQISIGRDGLIVRKGPESGLLLPQVPAEYGWNETEFLEHTCQKAGLPENSWKESKVIVEKFQGIIFMEESPGGNIIEKTP